MSDTPVKSDIEIAQSAEILPIGEIAAKLGIPDAALSPFGRTKAKIDRTTSNRSRTSLTAS